MKKLMFLLAAASLSSVAFAQQKSNSQNVLVGESVDVMEVPVDKYKVETNHFFDNWFFNYLFSNNRFFYNLIFRFIRHFDYVC